MKHGWYLVVDLNVIFSLTPFRAGRVCPWEYDLFAGPGRGRGGFGGTLFITHLHCHFTLTKLLSGLTNTLTYCLWVRLGNFAQKFASLKKCLQLIGGRGGGVRGSVF